MFERVGREAEHQLVAADLLVLGRLLRHLVGITAQHPPVLDQVVQHALVGHRVGPLGPDRHPLLVGNGVVVVAHQRVQIAPAAPEGDLTGPLPVAQADHRVGHHDVVVRELTQGLGAVGDALLVGLDPALQVVDRLEVEGDGADAELAGLRERARIAAPHPDGRVALAPVGLGEDVVGIGHREVLPLEHVVLLLPHPWDLMDDLVPLRLGRVLVQDVEGGDLVAARPSSGAPLEPALEEVVEHGDPLRRCRRGCARWRGPGSP